MGIYLIYDHNGHICLWVWIIIKVSCHGRILSPPVHNIWAMTVHSAMEGLPHFTNILLGTFPACNKIYYTGGLLRRPLSLLWIDLQLCGWRKHLWPTVWDRFYTYSSCPAQLFAGLLMSCWCQGCLYQEVPQIFGRQKAMSGGIGNVLHNRSETKIW